MGFWNLELRLWEGGGEEFRVEATRKEPEDASIVPAALDPELGLLGPATDWTRILLEGSRRVQVPHNHILF